MPQEASLRKLGRLASTFCARSSTSLVDRDFTEELRSTPLNDSREEVSVAEPVRAERMGSALPPPHVSGSIPFLDVVSGFSLEMLFDLLLVRRAAEDVEEAWPRFQNC